MITKQYLLLVYVYAFLLSSFYCKIYQDWHNLNWTGIVKCITSQFWQALHLRKYRHENNHLVKYHVKSAKTSLAITKYVSLQWHVSLLCALAQIEIKFMFVRKQTSWILFGWHVPTNLMFFIIRFVW